MILPILLLILAAVFVVYLAWRESQPLQPPPDPEAELRAAVELHAIRRRLEAAELKTAQRSDAVRLRRDIAHELSRDEDP